MNSSIHTGRGRPLLLSCSIGGDLNFLWLERSKHACWNIDPENRLRCILSCTRKIDVIVWGFYPLGFMKFWILCEVHY